MQPGKVEHFKRLFSSTQAGSVNEYYKEASGGKVSLVGDVVGPFTLPKKLTDYAHGSSGFGSREPNSQTMARDAVNIVKATQNLDVYDINGDGVVDAFVVVHAGSGAEVDEDKNKLWSLQWNIGDPVKVGNVSVYAFLTIPEDALLGVTVHELGHLVFSWPDLYDIDQSSSGLGSWCLMSGGSWNGFPAGSTPCHPSAWCKYKQGWVSATSDTENHPINLGDVKNTHEIHRLWENGDSTSSEYFLIENRQRAKYDAALPGDGLLGKIFTWYPTERRGN
jgi:immune inhibitor A